MSQARWNQTIGATASTLGLLVMLSALGCRSASSLSPSASALADPNARSQMPQGAIQVQPQISQSSFRAKTTLEQEYQVHMDLAQSYESQGSLQGAVSEYQQALEVCNRPARTLAFGQGQRLNAEQRATAHRRMAAALDRLGMFAQAESHYRDALAFMPNNANIWNDAGYSYYLQGRWIEAEQSLRTAARLAPTDTKIVTNLGLALAAGGKTAEAFDALAQVAGPAAAHANLGYVLASTGNSQEARRHYQTALQIQPEYAPFQTALSQIESQPPSMEPQTQPQHQPPVQQAQWQPPSFYAPPQTPTPNYVPASMAASMMAQVSQPAPVYPPQGYLPAQTAMTQMPMAPNARPWSAPARTPYSPDPSTFAQSPPSPPQPAVYPQDDSVARASAATGIPLPHRPIAR